jgi:hypothetical protein
MSTISTGTTLTTALVQTGDTTGDLVIKTGASNTTAMTISGTDQSVTLAGSLTANGSSITNINAASITSGTLNVARLPSSGVNAASITTGTLAVGQGGTGATSLTANNVILGNGTSAVQVVAPGTSGNILTSNGTTWQSVAPAGGGVTSLNGQTGAITNTSLYAIGSYIFGRPQNITDYAVNSTIAGSSLYTIPIDADWNGSSWVYWGRGGSGTVTLINTGTWRCMSTARTTGSNGMGGLWVRIS